MSISGDGRERAPRRETRKRKNRALRVRRDACGLCARPALRFHAHETSRWSNPPSRARQERPVATLLSTSLRPLPPLLLYPDSRLARIVAYGIAAPAGATPSGSRRHPFSLRATLQRCARPSVRPSASLLTIRIPCHPSYPPPRQLRTRRLQINDTNFSRMLPPRRPPQNFQLPPVQLPFSRHRAGVTRLLFCSSGRLVANAPRSYLYSNTKGGRGEEGWRKAEKRKHVEISLLRPSRFSLDRLGWLRRSAACAYCD